MVDVKGNMAEFTFYRPHAAQVFLAGDFNEWRESELAMTPTNDGTWRARMRLPDGEFKFRYCADGVWYTDYAAFGVEPGMFGLDSIVRVVAPTLKVPATIADNADVVAA